MKILLLTHKPDIDGMAPLILTKLVFSSFDYITLETFETNPVIEEFLKSKTFINYDRVFITDLSVNKDICDKIDENSELKSKILIFDHHNSHLFVNDYSFGTSINIDDEGNMQSGTSLYYQYLMGNYRCPNIDKKSVAQFVELVRQYDTWEWFNKYNNRDAKKLTDLFDIYGEDYFIKYYYEYLLDNEIFDFTENEEYLMQIEQERINRYIDEKSKQIIPVELLGHNVGVVFSENYRSELGNALARKYEDIYDFIVLINMARSVSYRGIKSIDLGEIASVFGGKGHVNSSSSSLPSDIKQKVIEMVFKDKVVVKPVVADDSILLRLKHEK